MTKIHGHVGDGFEGVADVFADNFDSRGEVGAEFCAYVDGERILDIWAGEAAPGRPWAADTLVPVFSVTKGLTALVAQVLADRSQLDLDAPVIEYWPEFGAAGKGGVLVRMLLDHTVGLPSFPEYWEIVSFDDPEGWHRTAEIARRLAAAPLEWEPGTRVGYHSITYGWFVAELVRRIDGRTLGVFFREEIAGPLDLNLWIGLPSSLNHRVAELLPDPEPPSEDRMEAVASIAPGTPGGAALFLGPEGTSPIDMANNPRFWEAEVPAVNGIGDARSVARMYGMLARGGELDGVRIVSEESIAIHSAEQARGPDSVFGGGESRVALGYGRSTPGGLSLGPHDEAFGMQGLGGALGYADPVSKIGFGYAMNQTRAGGQTDARARALSSALYASLE